MKKLFPMLPAFELSLPSLIRACRFNSLLLITILVLPSSVLAQFQPPEIIINEAASERRTEVKVTWDEEPTGGGARLEQLLEDDINANGPWQSELEAAMEGGIAKISHKSNISKFLISGKASAEAAHTDNVRRPRTNSETTVSIEFSVPVDALVTFSATYDFPGPSDTGVISTGRWGILGLPFASGDCYTLIPSFVFSDDETTWNPVCSQVIPANTPITLFIELLVSTTESGDWSGSGSVEFALDFGDRDGDGLLDVWEEEGVPVEGGGIIDLPSMGADPDHKDIFVEMDIMQGSAPYNAEAIDLVVAAFAAAPADLVDNPDGQPGIDLHVIVDGDQPEEIRVLNMEEDGSFPTVFSDIKSAWFGSATDRANPNWTNIRDARLHVFRYSLWAYYLYWPPQCIWLAGLAEGIPSNDMIIASQDIADLFLDYELYTAQDQTNAFAGVFMHELGHTLGLRHGGKENSPNFKPNYFSVMNYSYSVPFAVATESGTNAREVWVLDYSRKTQPVLDEGSLIESDGFGGDAGRKILFNSSPEGSAKSRLTIAHANATEIDWNNDGNIVSEVLDPMVDISRLSFKSKDCDGNETIINPKFDVLASSSDWDFLQYGLVGITQANDSERLPNSDPPQPGIDLNIIRSLLDAEWVDQTADPDIIFIDGFE